MSIPPPASAPRINTTLLTALVKEGLITQSDQEAATVYAKRRQVHAEEALILMGVLEEMQLLKFQANHYKTFFVSTKKLSSAPINDSLLKLITHKLATKLCIFPVKFESRTQELSILSVEPDDLDLLKNVQFATRVPKVRALVARPGAIQAAIRVHYEGEADAFQAIRNTGAMTSPGVDRDRPSVDYERASFAPPASRDTVLEGKGGGDKKKTRRRKTRTLAGAKGPPPPPGAPTPAAAQVPAALDPSPQPFAAPAATAPTLVAQPAQPAPAPEPEPEVDPALAALRQSELEHQTAKASPTGIAVHDYLETLNVFVALLENDRGDLRGHSLLVARICRRLCERLGLKQDQSDEIIMTAYMHDIGKTSAYHLTSLNVAEYEAHRQQARKSYLTPVRLFESVRLPDVVKQTLSHLYERYDGQGFPDRLNGKEIGLGSRILAIVETYADLTGHAGNPFRKKLTSQEAWEVLVKYKGSVFDPNLVDVFKLVVLGDDLRAKLLADSRRALIIDPDAEDTTVLELRLIERGFDVTIARNSRDAENELTNELDVVISEVDLKPIDGFALLQKARSDGSEVPWIFLSKHAEGDIVQRGFSLGADDFITKPAAPDVVALKVNQLLAGAKKKKKTGGVSGSLSEMGLPDVVQILYHGRKSGKLSISSGGTDGQIEFSEGMIFDANFGEHKQEEAFYAMLALTDGDFELDPNHRPTTQLIEMNPESLLLEGMRRQDEQSR